MKDTIITPPFLERRVTLFRNAKNPAPVEDLTVADVLGRVRSEKYRAAVERVLAAPPARQQDVKSIALPAFTPSGTFGHRSARGLRQHSGLFIVDLDDKTDPERTKAELAKDPHVLAAFRSPRGGVKVWVPANGIDPESGEMRAAENDAEHKAGIAVVFAHFGHVDPDPSGSDVSRLCFFSCDPNPYVNPHAVPLEFELGTVLARVAPAGRADVEDVIPHGKQYNTLAMGLGALRRLGFPEGILVSVARTLYDNHLEAPNNWPKVEKLARDLAAKPVDPRTSADAMARRALATLADVGLLDVEKVSAETFVHAPVHGAVNPIHDPRNTIVNGHRETGPNRPENAIHDSRPLRDRETVNGRAVLDRVRPLWDFEKPPPLRWAVHHFIPDGFASVLAADGGIGKSFLALYLAVCVALGRPFFGLATDRRRVLYVDYELDERVHLHRLHRVLEGMGLTPAEPGLAEHFFYLRPERNLPAGASEVAEAVEGLGIGLVILDSLTLASMGDVTDAQDTTDLMRALGRWGTVLALDHVSGASARGNAAEARPFGSVFKRNLARATFTLAKAEGGGFILRPDKNNFAAPQDLVCFAHEFEGDEGPVVFRRLDVTDEAMVGAHAHLRASEVTFLAISELHADPGRGGATVSAEEVEAWLESHDLPRRKAGTIRNHFTALRRAGKIELDGNGGAFPVGTGELPALSGDGSAGDGRAGVLPELEGMWSDDDDLGEGLDTEDPF